MDESESQLDESETTPDFDDAQISTSSASSTDSEPTSAAPQRTAPLYEETVADSKSLARKLIRVSSNTTGTFSDLPTINSRVEYQWKLYGDLNDTLVDLTNDPTVNLQLLDLDSDNRLDRAEWSTTDDVTEYYLVASIILATDGLHLDSDRNYVDDIFYEIKEKDDIWTHAISAGDYVRVTFEESLYNSRDITVFAKSTGIATIGYSVIINNNPSLMDMDINEFTLESIPDFFKTTAGAWCTDAITESEFINSTQSYIQTGTIKVLRGQSATDLGAQTPAWVKTNACDWSNDVISDYEFLDGIYWLIDNGKVQLD